MTLNWPVVNISVSLDNASFFFKESGYLLAKTQNSTLCRLYSSCVGLNMVWFLNLCGTLNLKAMFTKRWVFILPMVIRKEEVLAGSLQTPWEAWLCDHCCKSLRLCAATHSASCLNTWSLLHMRSARSGHLLPSLSSNQWCWPICSMNLQMYDIIKALLFIKWVALDSSP